MTPTAVMEELKTFEISRAIYDEADHHQAKLVAPPGINEEVVRLISATKNEPEWMLDKRLKGLKLFLQTPLPDWGPDLSPLDLNAITYFSDPNTKETNNWEEVPAEIRRTFERLGIPEAEKKALGGVGGQFDSSVVYHNLMEDLHKKGVIFENMDAAVQKYPELVKKYFMTQCIPINDHKFIMLHAAVWSGGTFIYIPPGVKVELPLQAYFRMNEKGGGQFEHTLIIVDEGAELHYVEGCSSPRYSTTSLHAGGVEIFVKERAKMRYSSIENWSKNVYNLNTKRALVDKDATMIWVSGNMGCLTEDTVISTNPKGPVKIKDISSNDCIFSYNEKTRKIEKDIVKSKIFSGKKDVFNLLVAGREIQASSNHLFLKIRRNKLLNSRKGSFIKEWTPLEKLKVGEFIAIAKKLPLEGKPYQFPNIKWRGKVIESKNQYTSFIMKKDYLYKKITLPTESTEELMWFLGLYLADGNLWKPKNRGGAKINIAVPETSDFREYLKQNIIKLFNCKKVVEADRYIVINSDLLATFLEKNGFGGNAGTKKVPGWIFTLPESQILAFLAGYFDGDGHTGYGCIYLTSINKELLKSIQLLAIQIGFGTSRIFSHRKAQKMMVCGNLCNARDSWRIILNGSKIKDLPTKSQKYRKQIGSMNPTRSYSSGKGFIFRSHTNEDIGFARIEEIIPLGEKETYDLEIERQHNFVANGIIVHNSKVSMLYPCSILRGEGARSDSLGIAFAGEGQQQDVGAKAIHIAPKTSSTIHSKSISKNGGVSSYRGLVKIMPSAKGSTTSVVCDALILDEQSISNTYPHLKIDCNDVDAAHEARVGKLNEETVFYLQSRGLSEEDAVRMIVSGFIQPIIRQLPLEYAVELNRLIELEVEGF